MYKVLILDENSKLRSLLEEIARVEDEEIEMFWASGRIDADTIIQQEAPQLMLVNTDSSSCYSAAKALVKQKNCPGIAIMGEKLKEKKEDKTEKKELQKLKALEEIQLPFDPDNICEALENALFKAEGKYDEITGLYKKSCFDYRMARLMRRKTKGTFFSLSLDAYSFADNPSNPLQLQTAAYAFRTNMPEDGITGINKATLLGFIPTEKPREETVKFIDGLIKTICEAAGDPPIYICGGAAESGFYDFSQEKIYQYADKATAVSRDAGKNCVKFYK